MNFKYKKPEDGKDKNGNPVKIYKPENYPNFYLWSPPELKRSGEFRQLVIHCINAMGTAKRTGYYFDIREYFNFHGVTSDMAHELRQAMIEAKQLTNPDWYNEYTPLIKEWMDNWKEKDGTTLKGLKCYEEYTPDRLKKIHGKLTTEKLIKCTESDFLKAFQAGAFDCNPLEWEGTNPELATLVHRLTGETPIPSIVNKYFKTKYRYDSNSHSGDRSKSTKIVRLLK